MVVVISEVVRVGKALAVSQSVTLKVLLVLTHSDKAGVRPWRYE